MNSLLRSTGLATTLLLSVAFATTAVAEIYKWTDAQGNTHYSQTPPQGKDAEASNVQNIVSDIEMAAGTQLGKTEDVASAKSSDSDEMAAAREAGKKNSLTHHTFCAQQKSALKQLIANPVIRWKSAEGESVLTANERQAKIDEFSGNIKEMCSEEVLATKGKVDVQ